MTEGANRKPEATGKAKIDSLHGRVIAGKFQIQELIGVGAMGRVYKAHNSALDKIVAVKVLVVPDGLNDPSHAIRFKAEARAASRIDHENSVQIYDFGTDGPDNLMYIAMEFLQGQNLGDVLKRVGKLSMLRASNIMMQVLAVLAVAHRNGVVHRDLKPANIMLTKKRGDDGEVNDFVKVCDFGIAKVMEAGAPDDATAMTMTKAGAVFGTPAYMSPEQARGEKIDFRTDLFSCGVILYRMIAGKTPFSAETAVGLLTKLMTEEPMPLSTATSMVDKRLEAIVHKAMQKDRAARFQTATDMRNALKEVLGDPSALEAPAAPQIPATQTPVRSRSAPGITLEPLIPPPRNLSSPSASSPNASSPNATRPPIEASPPAPFQTLTNSNLANRTGTWSGTGTIRPSITPAEQGTSRRTWLMLGGVGVAALAGWGIYRWQYQRTAIRRMQEMIANGSYGVAENIFHEHYDEMKNDPRALALIPEMLRKRREAEGDEARFGVQHDSSFLLEPSRWDVTFKEKEGKGRTQRYFCVFEHAGESTFDGYLDWPDVGIRAGIRGIRHGNHLVFWDYVVLSGPQQNYTVDDKKNAYITGEKLVGTDGPYLASITGTLKKKKE